MASFKRSALRAVAVSGGAITLYDAFTGQWIYAGLMTAGVAAAIQTMRSSGDRG